MGEPYLSLGRIPFFGTPRGFFKGPEAALVARTHLRDMVTPTTLRRSLPDSSSRPFLLPSLGPAYPAARVARRGCGTC